MILSNDDLLEKEIINSIENLSKEKIYDFKDQINKDANELINIIRKYINKYNMKQYIDINTKELEYKNIKFIYKIIIPLNLYKYFETVNYKFEKIKNEEFLNKLYTLVDTIKSNHDTNNINIDVYYKAGKRGIEIYFGKYYIDKLIKYMNN